MRTIILDDDGIASELLKRQIEYNPYMTVVEEFNDPKQALMEIGRLEPEVIFTEIKLPFMNGIEFAKKVASIDENIQIVFVTSEEGYALEAFKVNAINYILKPISKDDVNTTINRLLKNNGLIKRMSNKENKVYCLGKFDVYGKDGEKIRKWSTSKVKEIFAYFLHKRGQEVDKWEICDILWRDFTAKKAEHNLHSSIYRLKNVLRTVGIEGIIYTQSGRYGVDFSNFSCDLWDFQDFIQDNEEVDSKNIEKYEKAISLYKGEFLGNRESLWALELNERIRRDYIQGIKKIARYYIENKSYIKAYDYLNKIVNINSFDEEAHELIMEVYFHLGDRIGLMSYYNKLNEILDEELHIPIKESTKKLYRNFLENI